MTDIDINTVEFGFIKVAACAPQLCLAEPAENAKNICRLSKQMEKQAVQLLLFPELCITGYTCEDLFFTAQLQQASHAALLTIAEHSKSTNITLVVGAPILLDDGRLLNCALVIAQGKILGAVPKTVHPNYGEFYDHRWFVSGSNMNIGIDNELGRFQICSKQLFKLAGVRFAIEICEDLWAPNPPGITHALAGADLIINPSASPELISKADYRRDLVRMASAQRICAYLYASSGAYESTKDLVFGGHLIAAENGQVLCESQRFALTESFIVAEFDTQKLRKDRSQNSTFAQSDRPVAYSVVDIEISTPVRHQLDRIFPPHPFVPADENQPDARALEILSIQATGLARRMRSGEFSSLIIGLSGGLDSTLAFLVCLDCVKLLDLPLSTISAITMPGPGTSPHTLKSARDLAAISDVHLREIEIYQALEQHLEDIGHPENLYDRVYENAQARERTQILFDCANQLNGIVVGTGDLSELALGWCTFNADHMASYNVNVGVPKTLISYLMRWYATHRSSAELSGLIHRILSTPISPELLPRTSKHSKNDFSQKTEDIIGPYELHDYFLYHYVRNGFSPKKIHFLACTSFDGKYNHPEIKKWLLVFLRRFFSQQFKRSTLPAGPKIGSVSLSPRGDWRMPDEANVNSLLSELESL